MSGDGPTHAGVGARLRILGVVALNVALALAATVAIVWLSGRPGLRRRFDLTAGHQNTADAQVHDLLRRLDGEVELDAFFRPEDPPFDGVFDELQARFFGDLMRLSEADPERVRFTNHPFALPNAGGTELLGEMVQLGVGGEFNSVVVSYREPGAAKPRRTVLRLLGDVAEVDGGNPARHEGSYRPPSVKSYRGEEALLKALLKVSQGERPLAVFAKGHGERALLGDGVRELGRLHSALVDDGFRVQTWDPSEDGPLPADTAVLALCGPEEPYSAQALEWMADYVRHGGSVIVAPGLELPGGQGSAADLLTKFGILVRPGLVCRPFLGADGLPTFGTVEVAGITVRAEHMANHPIVDPLRRGDRRVQLVFAHPLERLRAPTGGVLLDLLRSSEYTWEEFPEQDGSFTWTWDQGKEASGPFVLAMCSIFPPPEAGPAPAPGTNPERPECRALAIGTPEVFANQLFDVNRDFLLNAFNWAASREFRVTVQPREYAPRLVEIGSDRTLFWLNLLLVWCLPLACLAGAAAMFLRRRA